MQFIRTDKDAEGTAVRVENAFRNGEGRHFLLLHRLPPTYTKPPTFLVELSADQIVVRGEQQGDEAAYYKAYAIQGLTDAEVRLLSKAKPGKAVSLMLSIGCPTVTRYLGTKFACLSQAEAAPLLGNYRWKLVGGMR